MTTTDDAIADAAIAGIRQDQAAAGWPAGATPEARPALEFTSLKELRERVQAAGPRRWLLRGIWPAADYGVHGGEPKAQKTWNTVDLAVSVASGTPWLGHIDIDLTGPVLMFVGEGGEHDLLRRIDAVAQGTPVDDLPIVTCMRAPHLTDRVHLGLMADQLDRVRPVLTTIDPLYLAARGGRGTDLYAMGEILEEPQHLCQAAGSALWVPTHLNRKEGRGAMRITGAGPAEWGRVLVTATVTSRHTDPHTRETTVITELDVVGGSVADRTLRVVRRIRADRPDDLDSPLYYRVEVSESDQTTPDSGESIPPARGKLLAALQAHEGVPVEAKRLVDWIAEQHGHGLRRETVSRELNALSASGHADAIKEPGKASLWFRCEGSDL